MKKFLYYFSLHALIICFLIATVVRFPPNLNPWFIEIARSPQVAILLWINPYLFAFFLSILFFSLINLPYFKNHKFKRVVPACICLLVVVFYNLLSNLWADKIMMSWLWKKDLETITLLAKQKQLKIVEKYTNSDTAVLPEHLRYLSLNGFVQINLYKTHENEMTIVLLSIEQFMSSCSFYYSSLDLPPTPKNKLTTFGNTTVGTIRKIMPHWYLIEEIYD